MILDAMKDLGIAQIHALVNEGPPHEVVGGVVEVLGRECCCVDGGITWVRLADDMLLD
jgi:hypothetical protein